jgi:glyoxylase-like metal-dependent hydrolase (beta-lactamase superfamily II)
MVVLPAHNPSNWTGPTGNNTYLLTGRVPTLIDAGVGKPEHVDAIARELQGAALSLVLLTHGHPDHKSGSATLAARWPGVRIRLFGEGEDPIRDQEVIEAGNSAVTALHTPGHSPDHCCFRSGDDIFCGDLARLGGTVVIPGSRGGDLTAYLASLKYIRALQPRRLLPGHGPIIDDPDAVIDYYMRHRAERDEQIVAALTRGPRTPAEIAATVYGTLAPELTAAAADSVLAHLIKLKSEGRVVERDEGWLTTVQAG